MGGGKLFTSLVLAPLFFFTLSSFTPDSGSSPSGQPSAVLAVPAVQQQQKVQQPKRTLRPQKVKGQKARKRGVRRGDIIEYGTPARTDSVHIIVPPADSIRTGHVEDAA